MLTLLLWVFPAFPGFCSPRYRNLRITDKDSNGRWEFSQVPAMSLKVQRWDLCKSLNFCKPHQMVSIHVMRSGDNSCLATVFFPGHTSKTSSYKLKAWELKGGLAVIKQHIKDKEIEDQKGWLLAKLIALVFSNTRDDSFDLRRKTVSQKKLIYWGLSGKIRSVPRVPTTSPLIFPQYTSLSVVFTHARCSKHTC